MPVRAHGHLIGRVFDAAPVETGEILFKANYKFGPGVVVAKY